MFDPGLKSYQDIREPEYEEDNRKSLEEWMRERDLRLGEIFDYVLALSRELDVHLFFEWSPHVNGVYVSTYGEDAKWHSGEDNKVKFIINGDCIDPDIDPGDWEQGIFDRLENWANEFRGETE